MKPCCVCRQYAYQSPLTSPCVIRLVSDAELSSPRFVFAVCYLAYLLHIPASKWHGFLIGLYRDLDVTVVDENGREVFLDTEEFEPSDEEIDVGEAGNDVFAERLRYWFHERFCVRPNPRRGLRREARERFRVAATLLAAAFEEAVRDVRIEPANDNDPAPSAANDNDKV